MATSGLGVVAVALAIILGTSAQAQAPPQPPPPAHHPAPKRNAPTPPNAAVSQGLSLEHECLNALQATRATPKMKKPHADDEAKRASANDHLAMAESAARAGHGQACQDELSLANDNLK